MSVVRKFSLLLVTVLIAAIAAAGVVAWTGGYHLYIVHTGSMAPALLAGDAVLDSPPKDRYKPGEIITFRHSSLTTDLVTHRVADLAPGVIHTKGDANRTADVWDIRPEQVQGVVATRLPGLGYVLIFLRKPIGIAAVLVGGLALVMLWRLFSPGKEESAEDASPLISADA